MQYCDRAIVYKSRDAVEKKLNINLYVSNSTLPDKAFQLLKKA